MHMLRSNADTRGTVKSITSHLFEDEEVLDDCMSFPTFVARASLMFVICSWSAFGAEFRQALGCPARYSRSTSAVLRSRISRDTSNAQVADSTFDGWTALER
jgi:hypothetical protein